MPPPEPYVEPVAPFVLGRSGRIRRWFARGPGAWDLFAGAIAPVILIAIDRPALARHSLPEGALLFRPYSTILILLCAAAMVVWWKTHDRPRRFHTPLAGALFVGTVFSFGIAVVLTPLALIGLFVLIGILGFFPWITCAVFLRAAARARTSGLDAAEERSGGGVGVIANLASAAAGAVILLGLTFATGRWASVSAEQATRQVQTGTPAERDEAVSTLRALYYFPQVPLDRLALRAAPAGGGGSSRNVWQEITGDSGESWEDW